MDITYLFETILSLSFMGSIIAGIIILIKFLTRNKFSPTWHYYIWFLLIIRLVMPYAPESSLSIFNLFQTKSQEIKLTENAFANSMENNALYLPINTLRNSNLPKKTTLVEEKLDKNTKVSKKSSFGVNKQMMGIVWVTGAIFMFLYIIVLNIKVLIKINNLPRCEEKVIVDILEECKAIMKVKAKIPIICDKSFHTPALLGLILPKLLISPKLIKELTLEEIKYVFLHELSHVKRKDILINWVTILVQGLHWFNPIIWYSFYKLREDCEVSCDSFVLSKIETKEYKKYGVTIINLIQTVSKPYWICASTGMAGNKSCIKRRIKMISGFKKSSLKLSVIATSLIVFVATTGLTNSLADKKEINNNVNKGISINVPIAKEDKKIRLYFSDDQAEYLVGEDRIMNKPTPKSVIQELIKGPKNPKLFRTVPESTKIIDVKVKSKIAYVNLDKNINVAMEDKYGTSALSRMFLGSIVDTLNLCGEFDIDKVMLLVDGKKQTILGPLAIDEPFTTDYQFYVNRKFGFTLQIPASWSENYKIDESSNDFITVSFIGKSNASKNIQKGSKAIKGLPLFYIGKEKYVKAAKFIDSKRKIGTSKNINYYYYTNTDSSIGSLFDVYKNPSIKDKKEKELAYKDYQKARNMQKDIDNILKSILQK